MKKFGLSLIIAASLCGCDSETDDTTYSLDSTEWVLTEYNWLPNSQSPQGILPNTSYKLQFVKSENKVLGTIDCNSFESSYTASENTLSIEYIATTKIGCSYATSASDIELEQYNDQNEFIVLALSTINSYSLNEDEFSVISAGGQYLKFVSNSTD